MIELAREEHVAFITKDLGFFEDKKTDKGLASNLKSEAAALPHRIDIYYGLEAFLKTITKTVPAIDSSKIASSIHNALIEQLNQEATDREYQLAQMKDFGVSAYLTESTSLLAVDFELLYNAAGVIPTGETTSINAIRQVKGNCSWNLDNHSAADIRITEQKMLNSQGEEIPGFNFYYFYTGGFSVGRKTHKYRLNAPLPGKPA